MGAIHFSHGSYLYALLLVVPLAVLCSYASYRLRQKARQQYGQEKLLKRYSPPPGWIWETVQAGAWLVLFSALIISLAGPIKSSAPEQALAGTLQIVAVMDVSWSMGAEDYRPTMVDSHGTPGPAVSGPFGSRLDMAKQIIMGKIMPAVPGNQIGIVTYMGNGFPQADLTDDHAALRFVLDHWVTTGSAPGGGSNMADGLEQALETFNRDPGLGRQKVIVLFSDGGSSSPQAELDQVLDRIAQNNIRLIVVGVGLSNPLPIPVYDDKGQLLGYRAKQGKVVTTAYEESLLEQVAAAAGGQLLHIDETGSSLNIGWAPAIAGHKTKARQTQLYMYPLAAGMAVLLLLSFSSYKTRRSAG